MEPVDFEQVLVSCLSIDNQVRKQAEEKVKALSSHPQILTELVRKAQEAQGAQVRHLAAVLLRKRIDRHWGQQTAEARTCIQEVLLQRLTQEPEHSVRVALAHDVGALARLTIPHQQWPALMTFLYQCSASSSREHKEVAMLLFASLMEQVGDHLQPHLGHILSAVSSCIDSNEKQVVAAGLKVVEPSLHYLAQEHVPAFHQLLGVLLACGEKSLAARDEEVLMLVCQTLVEVAESPAPLLQPVLPHMLQMVALVAGNNELEDETRETALQLVHWLARFKPKLLVKQKQLLQQILELLCRMCCEPLPEGYDEAQQTPVCSVAAQTLDVLALHLPSQQVLPPMLDFVRSASGSADYHQREGAMMVLAVMAEGCAEPLRRNLPEMLVPVVAGLQDQHQEVRGKAAFALGQFSEYLQPEIMAHYQGVLPAIFQLLRDTTPEVQERACYAIDAFCENMEPQEILPYMSALFEALLLVLQGGSHRVQEMALSAMSSIAAAAGKSLQPYAGALLPVLQHFLQSPSSLEGISCHCKAIEAMGILASQLGPEDPVIGPQIQPFIESLLHGFSRPLDSPEIREYSHSALTHVAGAIGERFSQYLAQAVPLALQSCQQDDGADQGKELLLGKGENGDGSPGAVGGGQEEDLQQLEEDDEEGSDGDLEQHLSVRTGVLDEKVSSTSALGAYAEACPAAMAPYTEPVLKTLVDMSNYWHGEVRGVAYESMGKLLLATHKVFPPISGSGTNQQQQAAAGTAPSTPPVTLSQQTQVVRDTVIPALLEAAQDDDERLAVAAAGSALVAILQALGSAGLTAKELEGVAQMATNILKGEAFCQEEDSDDDGDEGDDGSDADAGDEDQEEEDLVAAAADLLPALAACIGAPAYEQLFLQSHGPALLKRLRQAEPAGIRALASGAFAEVTEVLGSKVEPLVGKAMTQLLKELKAEDAINRQNAAFCCGILVEVCPSATSGFMQQVLLALHPMFGEEEEPGARDNAAGAVGRMLLAYGGNLPLEQVLPVLLGALPLKEDMEETDVVVKALSQLLLGDQAQRISSLVPQVVQVFGALCIQDNAPMSARAHAAVTMARLNAQYPQHMEPLFAGLPAEQKAAMQQLATTPQ